MTDLPDTDFTQRFIFDESDARGEMVSLERSYAEVLAKHPYPEPVAQLLGELMAAAALLVGTMKFDGLLILQARSEGPVPMLMIECSSEREIRGLARYEADRIAPDATLSDLMANGVLAITVDPTEGQRYQGIVDLDGETLSDCFTNYFVMSQQVGTKFWLNATRAAVGPDFPIIFRFSQWKQQDYTARLVQTPEALGEFLKPLSDAGVDIFHCSTRRFWEPEFEGSDLNLAGWTRQLTGKPTITVGSVGLDGEFLQFMVNTDKVAQPASLEKLLERLNNDEFDLVAVGRALLVDPDWAVKVREGREGDILPFSREALTTLV